jgi:hypothetical protein
MKENLKDILSNSNKDIDNQKLMDYLSGKLSGEELHEMEKAMTDSEFMSDAVEGLESFKEKKDINLFVEQLNRDLQKNLDKKKSRKKKRMLKDNPWILTAIAVVLLLIVIAFFVIKRYLETH